MRRSRKWKEVEGFGVGASKNTGHLVQCILSRLHGSAPDRFHKLRDAVKDDGHKIALFGQLFEHANQRFSISGNLFEVNI